MPELRTVFRVFEGSKEKIRLSELKTGDKFEMYEDDLLIVTAIATGEPAEKDGVWGINAEIMEKQ